VKLFELQIVARVTIDITISPNYSEAYRYLRYYENACTRVDTPDCSVYRTIEMINSHDRENEIGRDTSDA